MIKQKLQYVFAIVLCLTVVLNFSFFSARRNISITEEVTITKDSSNTIQDNKDKLAIVELAIYYEQLLRQKRKFSISETDTNGNKIANIENKLSDRGKPIKSISQLNQNVKITTPHESKGILIDWWRDICLERVSWEPLWHPLFPHIPQHSTTVAKNTEDIDRIVGQIYRRIYGFFSPKKTSLYDFQLASRDGAEVIIMDTGLSKGEIKKLSSNIIYEKAKEIMHLKLTKELMDTQDEKIRLSEMFTTQLEGIKLKGDRLYFIEIIQGGKYFIKYSLTWREKDTKVYVAMDDNVLFHISNMNGKNTPSVLKQKYNPQPRYPYGEDELRRLSFHEKSVLDSTELILKSQSKCGPVKKDYKKIAYLYQTNYEYLENIVVYPKEHFVFMQTVERNVSIPEDEAKKIAAQTFKMLNNVHDNKLNLVGVVHVQRNSHTVKEVVKKHEDPSKTFYFVELDVKFADEKSKIYRASHFIKPLPANDICFATDYEWTPKVTINLLTPIRNQISWFLYMIQMLEEIVIKTKDANINLILIDYDSTDGNYREILKSSKLKHTYLNPLTNIKNYADKKFNKVKALNYGIKHVKDKDSIVFVLDLHLQLPLNIFDRIRKLTTQGRTAFSPSLMKLGCGEHEQYTDVTDRNSLWLDNGTGMMAMYKSDWDFIGGYNEKKFANQWGGEDWEVMDRIVSNGIYIIHQRMQRFYHVHHSKAGMWNYH